MIHKLNRFHGGLHLPDHKAVSMQAQVTPQPLPKQLVIPLQQHIGAIDEPSVNPGERVLKGQLIARSDAHVSAPIHAPSSGTIVAIEARPVAHPSGMPAACIVIETDGKDEWTTLTPCADYTQLSPETLRQRVHEAGIVGLGGAGFPSFIKLTPGIGKVVETLILNGAECEPYITCDAMLMQARPDTVLQGAQIMLQAVQARHCLIGVEDNKPTAIAALQHALQALNDDRIRIVPIPTIYPTGGERQLIKVLTGKETPTHKLPIDVGVVCHNVATAAAVADAIIEGKPLISRYVTVTGAGIGQAHNLEVLIGTPMQTLLEECAARNVPDMQTIMGGPMMGFVVEDLQAPVIKTTNCLLHQTKPQSQAALPCIRCGECMRVCPAQLLPQQLYWHARAKDLDKTQDYKLFDCIECGCCAYVCPSHIPLVHYYRFAKTEIWAREREKLKSDHARERHEFHLQRLERKKQEDEERKRKKRELLQRAESPDDNKQDAIAAALERVKAKKAAQQVAPQNTENLTTAQQAKIDAIESRRKTLSNDSGQDEGQ